MMAYVEVDVYSENSKKTVLMQDTKSSSSLSSMGTEELNALGKEVNMSSSSLSSMDTEDLDALGEEMTVTAMECDDKEDELESISSLKPKMLALVAYLFPGIVDPKNVVVQHVGAGTYNRVFGITFPQATKYRSVPSRAISTILPMLGFTTTRKAQGPGDGTAFVVRIPMDNRLNDKDLNYDIDVEIANLQFLGPELDRLSVPIPEIFVYELNNANPIGRPYVLQGRLPGRNFDHHLEAMNDRQLASAVAELTRMIEKIATVSSDRAGHISPNNQYSSASAPVIIDQFDQSGPAVPQSPVEFLKKCCREHRKPNERPDHTQILRVWDQILVIIDSLDRRGWLGPTFHLLHDDLFPRNILGMVEDENTGKITGIVDWDLCMFVPKCVALRPPYWAWMDKYEDERDDDNASYQPNNVRDAMAKEAFLDAASDEFVQCALAPEGILTRKLFDIVVYGMKTEYRRKLGERLVERWHRLHPEDGVFN